VTTTVSAPRRAASSGRGIRRGEAAAGWIFTLPVLIILGVFLLIPVLMALWVSFSDWSGRGSPFSSDVQFVGLDNYAAITSGGGLAERDFGIALRNNAWYVLLVVPLQTALSLFLAVLVNRAVLRGRGFFRTAFYFPSVTSSVAITVLWLFLFSTSGAVNGVLAAIGIAGPNWFNDPRGVLHNLLGVFGVQSGPEALTSSSFLGVSWWDWLAGPSVAMRPTLFTVLTLGLIGTWQVFDQIYTGTQGAPGKTTLTPAYLSYNSAFISQEWGQGAAIAFVLFVIIVAFTILQRFLLRERPVSRRRAREYEVRPATQKAKEGRR
jgi:multiple sugar transport system permease protein